MFSGTVLLMEFDGAEASKSLSVRLALDVVTLSMSLRTVEVNDLINHQQLKYLSLMLRINNNKNVAKHFLAYKIILSCHANGPYMCSFVIVSAEKASVAFSILQHSAKFMVDNHYGRHIDICNQHTNIHTLLSHTHREAG